MLEDPGNIQINNMKLVRFLANNRLGEAPEVLESLKFAPRRAVFKKRDLQKFLKNAS